MPTFGVSKQAIADRVSALINELEKRDEHQVAANRQILMEDLNRLLKPSPDPSKPYAPAQMLNAQRVSLQPRKVRALQTSVMEVVPYEGLPDRPDIAAAELRNALSVWLED